jgi:hypothetical protein
MPLFFIENVTPSSMLSRVTEPHIVDADPSLGKEN